MNWYPATLAVHGGLGVLALLTYWLAGLARKGSPLHKAAGKLYLLSMIGLLLPALPLAIRILVGKNTPFGLFLLYLLVLTATAVWQGWFAIRRKHDFRAYAGPTFRGLAAANLLSAAGVLLFGLMVGQPIFIGFSVAGLLGGRGMWQLARQGPTHPRWWLEEHMSAMIVNGVATHIAFLAIGLPRLLPALAGPAFQIFAWLGPLALAVAARIWLARKYRLVARTAVANMQVA